MIGTGLHKYWYLRLLALALTVIIPFAVLIWVMQHHAGVAAAIDADPYRAVWGFFIWLIYTIAVVLIESKIEDVLQKRNGMKRGVMQNIIINGTDMRTGEMNAEQQKAFNEAFKEFNEVFQNSDDDSEK